jgi:Glycosyl hydrolase family 26
VQTTTVEAAHRPGMTRRDAIARGSLALLATSPLLRLAHAEVASAAVRRGRWAFGAFANPEDGQLDAAGTQQAVRSLEALVEDRVQIVSSFVAWDEPFPNAAHALDRDAGRRPLIAWYTDGDLAAVASGEADELLRERAQACRDFGSPIYIRWAAEFNDASNAAYGRPAEFVAAWRRIVTVFRAAGATNVRWVWCPLALEKAWSPADDWRRYYPGDRYVDWVGMDGYNWGTTRSWSKWQSFADIFGPVYFGYARRKPIMICELGCVQAGGDKAAWIRDMGARLAGPFSRVRAVVWFQANKENDWRIDSSSSSLAAFRSVVAARRAG